MKTYRARTSWPLDTVWVIDPTIAAVVINLASSGVWAGGQRLTAAIGRWLSRPGAVDAACRVVSARTGLALPSAAVVEWLKTPTLVQDLVSDADTARAHLRTVLVEHGVDLSLDEVDGVLTALVLAIVASDAELAGPLFRADAARQLDQLSVGLHFVFGELLDEILAVRTSLPARAGRDVELEVLLRESEELARMRWMVLGVPEELAADIASDRSVGFDLSPHAGEVNVFTASAGSGKSLAAIRTHQVSLVDAVLSPTAPLPVLIDARHCDGRALRDLVTERTSALGDPRTAGVALVLDGLDEVSRAESIRLLSESTSLVGAWPSSSVVALARPDAAVPGFTTAPLPLPDPAALESLAERICGFHSPFHGLAPAVRQAATLPLYAIAAAVLLSRRREVPQSRAALLDELVRLSLKDGDIADDEVLRELAARTLGGRTVSIGDFGTERAHSATKSRLVTLIGGRLSFVVPIYEEWFAARHCIETGLAQGVADGDLWEVDRWRHALALAIAIGSPDQSDSLLQAFAKSCPAMLSAVIHDATSSNRFRGADTDATVGTARLKIAVRSVVEEVSKVVGGNPADEVDVAGTLAECHGSGASVHILNHRGDALGGRGGIIDGSETPWPWRFTVDTATHLIDRRLKHRNLPSTHPIAHAEMVWGVARALINETSLLHDPIDASLISDLLEGVESIRNDEPAAVVARMGRLELPPGGLRRVAETVRAAAAAGEQLVRPWPRPDSVSRSDGWTDSLYSNELAAAFHSRALMAGVEIYVDLVAGSFPHWARWLSTSAALPARIEVSVPLRDSVFVSNELWHKLNNGETTQVALVDIAEFQAAADQRWELWLSGAMERSAPFTREHTIHNGVIDSLHANRPATLLAYRWLFEDLRQLEWATWPGPNMGRHD